MTIEIHQPELEALIQQRMDSGRYLTVEDILMQALAPSAEAITPQPQRESLDEMFAKVRGLADDLDLTRDPSPAPRAVVTMARK